MNGAMMAGISPRPLKEMQGGRGQVGAFVPDEHKVEAVLQNLLTRSFQ